ncbi:MAG TPA: hypothetical protein VGJ14_07705 [Sporichthyaceae bacterium]|jgi:hypothetical protein
MRSTIKVLAAGAAAATVALSLSACGSDSTANAADVPAGPVANISNLQGEKTEVILDQSFLDGLKSLKLTPGVLGKATLKSGTLAFPITGGAATYYTPGTREPYVESTIFHDGSGISLSDGKTTVELTDFVVDAGQSLLYGDVSANGKSVVHDTPLFILNGATLEPLKVDKSAGTAVLYGTKVGLTDGAAKLLDQTYKTDALKENFPIGTARITLKLPQS